MSKRNKYGLSVDIGTTNITFHLVRYRDKALINQLVLKNPQSEYGFDVLSRIRAARKSKAIRDRLVSMVRKTIERGIAGLLEESKIKPNKIADVAIVGNTVMHHFFFDLPTDSLISPPYLTPMKESILKPASELGLRIPSEAEVYSPPIVESFIGSDAIAVLFASGYLGTKEKSMVIDVGTNTEVSVITPEGIWIASAASGPAFEGMTIEHGMSGETGAIESVSIDPDTLKPTISILGDTQPRGICGTGAISLIASLTKTNLLLPRGSFNREKKSQWTSFDSNPAYYIVAPRSVTLTGNDIILTQLDIRLLQQSKAAIRAAIELLLVESESTPDEISNLFLTGIFGSNISIDDACNIGLLPYFSNVSLEQSRNGAIQGADLLLHNEYRVNLESIVQQINFVQLMDNEEFNKLFVESLPFFSK